MSKQLTRLAIAFEDKYSDSSLTIIFSRMYIQYMNSLTFSGPSACRSEVPTFFLNEGIKGCINLQEIQTDGLKARIRLIGTVCLDTTQTLSHYGALEMRHAPIDSRTLLDISQEKEIISDIAPFYLELTDISSRAVKFPASVNVASSCINTDFDLGPGSSHFLIASVIYMLEVSVQKDGVEQCKAVQEVRFLSSSVDTFENMITKSPLKQPVAWKQRLPSLKKLTSQRQKQYDNLSVEVSPICALNFGSQSDAAATKASVKLIYTGHLPPDTNPEPLKTAISWNLQSSTDLMLTDAACEQRESSLELRKDLSRRSQQVTFSSWSKEPSPVGGEPTWFCEHEFWITEPLQSWLTPSFCTPYLSQKYSVHLHIKIEEKGHFNGRKASLDIDLPIAVSYEQGSVPSYSSGRSPPEYVCTTA